MTTNRVDSLAVSDRYPAHQLLIQFQPRHVREPSPLAASAARVPTGVHVAGADLHDEQAVQALEGDGAVDGEKSVASIVVACPCRNCRHIVSVCGSATKKDTVNAALREVTALAARRRDLRRLTSRPSRP